MEKRAIIELSDVSKSYATSGHIAMPLCGITASVPQGAFITITGPSGTGKSTLFRLLARLEEPDKGRIVYQGKPLSDWNPPELRRNLHYVFQVPILFPGTVADNLDYPAKIRGGKLEKQEMQKLLDRVSLPRDYLSRNVGELSGGEKQRVNIARSLSLAPDVLLLDEPTSALDKKTTEHIEQEIRNYHAKGHTILWITHSPEQATRLGNIQWHLEDGRLKERTIK